MKIIVAFLLVVAALYVDGACVEKYTTKYDSFDIDSVLSNRRLLESYVNCLLEKGKCTKEGVELKKHIPDALETECSKCSETQKETTEKVIKHLIEQEQDFYDELAEKYDPCGNYKRKYYKYAKEQGVTLPK